LKKITSTIARELVIDKKKKYEWKEIQKKEEWW
jgi:hypothetical protein